MEIRREVPLGLRPTPVGPVNSLAAAREQDARKMDEYQNSETMTAAFKLQQEVQAMANRLMGVEKTNSNRSQQPGTVVAIGLQGHETADGGHLGLDGELSHTPSGQVTHMLAEEGGPGYAPITYKIDATGDTTTFTKQGTWLEAIDHQHMFSGTQQIVLDRSRGVLTYLENHV